VYYWVKFLTQAGNLLGSRVPTARSLIIFRKYRRVATGTW